jgi:alpha-ribazole phosphatase
MGKRLILLRHAESEASARGVASGDPDAPIDLTARGEEQARATGAALQSVSIELCATSRFKRARRTADLALAGRQVRRLVLPDLDDLRSGRFEGQPLEEYRAWARTHPMMEPLPGGESRTQVGLRYCRAIRQLLGRDEETILVVAHGLPLTYLVSAARGELPQPVMRYIACAAPCSLSSDEVRDAVERLETWAGTMVTP